MKRLLKRLVPFAVIFILTVIFFLPIFQKPEGIIDGVDTSVTYSWKAFVKEELSNGRLPLWNPNDRTGTPYFAHVGTEIWYPANLLYVILPIPQAMNASLFLHVLMAAFFTYLLSRSLGLSRISGVTAAVCFAFSGYLPARIFAGHREILEVISWIPVIFFFLQEYFKSKNIKFLIIGGLSLGFQMIGAYPAVFVYTLEALAIFVVFAPQGKILFRFVSFLKMGLIAVGLSCILLIPFLEFSQLITRSVSFNSYEQSVSGSFSTELFNTFVNPFFFGNPINSTYKGPLNFTEMVYYPGIFTLLLACLSIFGLKRNLFSTRGFLVILIAFLLIAFGENTPLYKILWNLSSFYQKTRIPVRHLILFSFSLAILSGVGSQFLRKRFLKLLFLGLVIFDLFSFGKQFITVKDPEYYLGDKELFLFLSKDKSLFRLYPLYQAFTTYNWSYNMRGDVADLSTPLIHNVATVKTYDPYILKSYHDFTNKIEEINYYDEYNPILSNTKSDLINFLNAKYLLSDPDLDLSKQDSKRYKIVLESPKYKLFENLKVSPRFYLEPKNPKDSLEIVKFLPTEITFKLTAEQDTKLISSEIYYPGWRAVIDGKETNFDLVYDTFRGQNIPKGTHEIRWYFLPYTLVLGATISLATLMVCFLVFLKKK